MNNFNRYSINKGARVSKRYEIAIGAYSFTPESKVLIGEFQHAILYLFEMCEALDENLHLLRNDYVIVFLNILPVTSLVSKKVVSFVSSSIGSCVISFFAESMVISDSAVRDRGDIEPSSANVVGPSSSMSYALYAGNP